MASHKDKVTAALQRRIDNMPGAVAGRKGTFSTSGFKRPGSLNRKKGYSARGSK